MIPRIALADLLALPTICDEPIRELKFQERGVRIWLTKVTNKVTIEALMKGRWVVREEYPAR